MYSDHSRNLCQDAMDDLAVSTSHAVFFYARGWCAAERGEPRDATQGSVWLEAYDLWHRKHPAAKVVLQ